MNESHDTLLYTLTSNLGRSSQTALVKRYSAQMKSSGTFGDAELQEALAAASGATVTSSNLVEVVCQFAELPSAGRYRLVVATRCGLGGEYRVVEAGREVEVVAG